MGGLPFADMCIEKKTHKILQGFWSSQKARNQVLSMPRHQGAFVQLVTCSLCPVSVYEELWKMVAPCSQGSKENDLEKAGIEALDSHAISADKDGGGPPNKG